MLKAYARWPHHCLWQINHPEASTFIQFSAPPPAVCYYFILAFLLLSYISVLTHSLPRSFPPCYIKKMALMHQCLNPQWENKVRILCSHRGRSVRTSTSIKPHPLAPLVPAFYPLGCPCVLISHPKRVACQDPNLQQVFVIEGEGKKEKGQRNYSAFASPPSCHGRDVTAPPFSLSRRCLMSDLKLLSSFLPPSFSLPEGREHGSVKCHVVVLGWVWSVMWRVFFEGRPKGKSAYHKCKSQFPPRVF